MTNLDLARSLLVLLFTNFVHYLPTVTGKRLCGRLGIILFTCKTNRNIHTITRRSLMSRKIVPITLVCLWLSATLALGQSTKLSHIIPSLYGPQGLFVESEALLPSGATHSAHFNSAFQSEFTQFNIALASQLTAIPLPSPASSFTYTYDEATGAFDRSTNSFGPILAERADTIGRGKFSFGFSFQSFTFDTIEGQDLSNIPAVFTHDGAAPGGKSDVVTSVNSIDARVGQFTTFFTYGLSDSFDVSLGIPMVSTELSVVSDTTVQRLGTSSNQAVHFFSDEDDPFGDQLQFVGSGSVRVVSIIDGTVCRVIDGPWLRFGFNGA